MRTISTAWSNLVGLGAVPCDFWAARYYTGFLVELTLKGIVFSFLRCDYCRDRCKDKLVLKAATRYQLGTCHQDAIEACGSV